MYACMYVIMYIFLGHEEPVYKALERLVCVCVYVCVRARAIVWACGLLLLQGLQAALRVQILRHLGL